jgi:hypothetical protein
MPIFAPRTLSIFAPLLIYFSAIGTLCGSIALTGAMLLAAPPSASVATEGKAAPIPAKFVRAADRAAAQVAKSKAETPPTSLVTPAAASIAAPNAAQPKGMSQKRVAAPRKKPAALAHSRPHQQPARALGYAAAPNFEPPFFARGQ